MMADLPTTPVQPVQPGPMSHEAERHHFAQANARWSDWIAQPPGAVWADWIAKNENEPLATWLKDHPDNVPGDVEHPATIGVGDATHHLGKTTPPLGDPPLSGPSRPPAHPAFADHKPGEQE